MIYKPGTDINGEHHLYHPSTGVKAIGFEIPNWNELLDYVKAAMQVVKGARLIAWDVAVTPSGFDMIEGNYNGDPGFMQAPSGEGKKSIIKENL